MIFQNSKIKSRFQACFYAAVILTSCNSQPNIKYEVVNRDSANLSVMSAAMRPQEKIKIFVNGEQIFVQAGDSTKNYSYWKFFKIRDTIRKVQVIGFYLEKQTFDSIFLGVPKVDRVKLVISKPIPKNAKLEGIEIPSGYFLPYDSTYRRLFLAIDTAEFLPY